MNTNDGVIEFYSRLITGIGPDNGILWMGNINVVPKREWDEQKK
jgi:hypothetical protein